MQKCAEVSERLRAILLPTGSKRTASRTDFQGQDEPHLKVFCYDNWVVIFPAMFFGACLRYLGL